MSDKDGRTYISRRKALAGIGTVGAAATLGGIGTLAQFTDTEETVQTFTAGGIDGMVRAGASYNGQDLQDFSSSDFEPQSEDGIGLDVTLDDIKPGDHGCFAFGISVENNPAWVAACLGYEGSIDGQVFEPEVQVDDDLGSSQIGAQGVDSDGELPAHLLTIPFYKGSTEPTSDTWDPCVFFDPELGEFHVQGYEGSGAVGTNTDFWDNSEPGLVPATLDDAVTYTMVDTAAWGDGGEVTTYDVDPQDSIAVGEGCVFLNGDGPSTQNQQGAAPLQPGDEIWFGWDWHLPFDTGNVVQGDSLDLKLGFVFGQTRHTESAQLSNVFAPQHYPGAED